MKKIALLFLVFLSAIHVFAQNFEGKIVYRNTYTSKNPQMPTEQLNAMLGQKLEYYIKGGDYKSTGNGSYFQWQLYINKDNKLYNKMSNSETLLWNDGGVNTDVVISAKVNKGVTEILGYKCDELILVCNSGTQKYYYNAKLGIDPKLYTKHTFGNWYEYVSRAAAVPLKTIIENEQFILESVATEIAPGKLVAKYFELPAGTKTEKSRY